MRRRGRLRPPAVGEIRADRHDTPYARVASAAEHLLAVVVENRIVNVGVRVEHYAGMVA